MVGFRKLQGISLLEFNNRFNDNLLDNKYVKKYLDNNIMSVNKVNNIDYLAITEEYIYVSNEIIINIIGEIYE